MSIAIDPQLAREIEERARARGFRRPGDYLADLVSREKQAAAEARKGPARQWIGRIRGTATGGLTTERVMELTRGEARADAPSRTARGFFYPGPRPW